MNLNRSISIRPLAATLLTAGIVFGGMSGSASADDPVRHRDADQGAYVEMAPGMVGIDKLQGLIPRMTWS